MLLYCRVISLYQYINKSIYFNKLLRAYIIQRYHVKVNIQVKILFYMSSSVNAVQCTSKAACTISFARFSKKKKKKWKENVATSHAQFAIRSQRFFHGHFKAVESWRKRARRQKDAFCVLESQKCKYQDRMPFKSVQFRQFDNSLSNELVSCLISVLKILCIDEEKTVYLRET